MNNLCEKLARERSRTVGGTTRALPYQTEQSNAYAAKDSSAHWPLAIHAFISSLDEELTPSQHTLCSMKDNDQATSVDGTSMTDLNHDPESSDDTYSHFLT